MTMSEMGMSAETSPFAARDYYLQVVRDLCLDYPDCVNDWRFVRGKMGMLEALSDALPCAKMSAAPE